MVGRYIDDDEMDKKLIIDNYPQSWIKFQRFYVVKLIKCTFTSINKKSEDLIRIKYFFIVDYVEKLLTVINFMHFNFLLEILIYYFQVKNRFYIVTNRCILV